MISASAWGPRGPIGATRSQTVDADTLFGSLGPAQDVPKSGQTGIHQEPRDTNPHLPTLNRAPRVGGIDTTRFGATTGG